MKGVGVEVAPTVPLAMAIEERVVAAGIGAVVTPAGTAAGLVPATKAAVEVVLPVMVWKMTCGTTTAVERTEVVEDNGMTVPDSEHGTTTVVTTEIVVTGTVAAGVTVAVTAGAQVMTAGLESTNPAQIPWK